MAGVELGAEKALEGSDSKSPLTHTMGRRAQLRVAAGFLQQYLGEGLNRRVNEVIKEQVASFAGYSVLVTGHSLGGALATLSAFEVASTFLDRQVLLTTFGSPRVVNAEFARVLASCTALLSIVCAMLGRPLLAGSTSQRKCFGQSRQDHRHCILYGAKAAFRRVHLCHTAIGR